MVHLILSENLCHQYLKKKLDFDFTFITRKNCGFPVFPRLTLTITTADGPSTGMKKKFRSDYAAAVWLVQSWIYLFFLHTSAVI